MVTGNVFERIDRFRSVQTRPSWAVVFPCCFPFNKVFTFGFSLVVPRTQQSRYSLSCFHLWLKLKLCKELTFWRQFNSIFLFPRQNWDKAELCSCSYRFNKYINIPHNLCECIGFNLSLSDSISIKLFVDECGGDTTGNILVLVT